MTCNNRALFEGMLSSTTFHITGNLSCDCCDGLGILVYDLWIKAPLNAGAPFAV